MSDRDEEILIPEEPTVKVTQTRILDDKGKQSVVVFRYPTSTNDHLLYGADPNCEHEIQAQSSGIKCVKCNGWYCA